MNLLAEAVARIVIPALYIVTNIVCVLAWLTLVGKPRDMITRRDRARLIALLLFGGPLMLLAWIGSWCGRVCEWPKMSAAVKSPKKSPALIRG